MIIRQGGGYDNIKEYLENGLKQSSSIHRDVKDKRIVLDGDLDIVNSFIQSIQSDGERYSHFTVSFKEDDVSVDDLDKVTQEVKKFLGAAYQDDEFQFYAEAHLPKIKSYIDAKSGKEVTRKPHIHIIMPKRNVIDGSYLNPMGYYKNNVKYIEALQEKINIDFNFESPKDNRRLNLSDTSDIISRYKGDIFKSDPRKIKEKILNRIMSNDIQSLEQFNILLADYGEVTCRNMGKPNEYLNVKPAEFLKGVNLKEFVFSRSFIELTHSEKIKMLSDNAESKEVRDLVKERKLYDAVLKDWSQKRSHEIRHMNPNSKVWKEYCKKSTVEQQNVIISLRQESLRKIATIKDRIFGTQDNPFDLLNKFFKEDSNGNPISFNRIAEISRKQPRLTTRRRNWLRSVSKRSVDDDTERGAESLLRDQVRLDVADEGQDKTGGRHNSVRWDFQREVDDDQILEHANSADGTAEYYLQELYEARAQYEQNNNIDWKKLQNSLDLNELINRLSHSHGLDVSLYSITKSKSGEGRIKSGNRRYSPSDFLTKVMNLDWAEAQSLLLEASKRQAESPRHKPRESSAEHQFWTEFRSWQYSKGNTYKDHWTKQRDSERQRFKDIRQQYKEDKSLHFSWNASASERAASLSILRLKKIAAEEELRNAILKERQAFRAAMAVDERYRDFLKSKIREGDEEALKEFRRFVKAQRLKQSLATFETQGSKDSILSGFTFEINADGSVVYLLNDVRMVSDAKDWVSVLDEESEDAIEIALRLTLDKFQGKAIILSGTDDFKKRVADVAAKRKIKVTFDDSDLDAYHKSNVAKSRTYNKEDNPARTQRPKRSRSTFRP